MIAAIETAIVQRLSSASKHGLLGYTLKTVESYGGQLDDEETLRRLAVQLPACFVVFLGEKGEGEHTNATYKFEARFGVIVVTRNARNEAATRHGAKTAQGQETGSYQIKRDVRLLLTDQKLGLGQGRMVPEGIKSLFNGTVNGKKMSVISLEFSMGYKEKYTADDTLPAELPKEVVGEALARAKEQGAEPGPAWVLSPTPPKLEEITATWLCPCGFETGTSTITPGKNTGEGETP